MTERQIDEFILAFGGRILEAEQEEVLPLHRYWLLCTDTGDKARRDMLPVREQWRNCKG